MLLPPKNPETLLVNANRRVLEMIRNKEIDEKDAIFYAFPFEAVKWLNPQQHLFIRPGIDPWPSPTEYKLNFHLPQLGHVVWEDALASGVMPLSLAADFLDHDFAHLTEYLSRPSLMAATREFYRQAVKRPYPWRVAAANSHLWPTRPHAGMFMMRVYFFAESFAVPDLLKEDRIRRALPHLFLEDGLSSTEREVSALTKLNMEQVLSFTEAFLKNYSEFLLRQGGSARDSYNYLKLAPDNLNQERVAYSIQNGVTQFKKSKDPLEIISVENLLNAQYEIQEIVRQFDQHRGDMSLQAKYRELLIDRVARAEVAIANGVKLGITPEQIVRDSGQPATRADSKTSRWLSTFLIPGTGIWDAFVSPESQRFPEELLR